VYDEIFDFTFPWFLLVSIWVWVWHPVLLRLWLGETLGAAVAPIFVLIVIGCCLTATSNVAAAQLGPLNRVGIGLCFQMLTCVLLVTGVYMGWHWNGVVGVAWAFLFSRIVLIAQDLFVIRLIGAGGWLATRTWRHLGLQLAVGLAFVSTVFLWPRPSLWQLIPACLHGCIIAVWVLHDPVRTALLKMRADAASQAT
jgi:hypothetical protein